MQNSVCSVLRNLRQVRSPLQLAGQKRTWQRSFRTSCRLDVVKPFVLADIGEGITEVQIIQWFVKPGARVEQFDKLCEVQSDKASVEITSRFDGVIKKLHYEQDDTAKVGRPLCDIDIEGDISAKDEVLLTSEGEQAGDADDVQQPQKAAEQLQKGQAQREESAREGEERQGEYRREGQLRGRPDVHDFKPDPPSESRSRSGNNGSRHHVSSLATPAVRGLLREHRLRIEDVQGTGRDGRVLKEDVHKFLSSQHGQNSLSPPSRRSSQEESQHSAATATPPWQQSGIDDGLQEEKTVSLTPVQAQMFKVMTRSLSIPHFVYADEIDLSALVALREKLKSHPHGPGKLSFLPFIVKAVSLALNDFSLLNSRIEMPPSDAPSGSSSPSSAPASPSSTPPKLVLRKHHNIGIAMDTPQGLLVPNVKNVASHSISSLSGAISSLQTLALNGKLTATQLTGGTVTVSNIGSIGGTYVSPVIVQGEVAILGVGRARTVPAFDVTGAVVPRTVANFSWSADHRVVDGATMARMAERVKALLEEPGVMLAGLR